MLTVFGSGSAASRRGHDHGTAGPGRPRRGLPGPASSAGAPMTTVVPQVVVAAGTAVRGPLATTATTERRRYRSRSCRNFRRYGAFFQFSDPTRDAAMGIVRRGRRFHGGRASNGREDALVSQLAQVQAHVAHLEERRALVASALLNSRQAVVDHAMDVTKEFYVLFTAGLDPNARPEHWQRASAFLRAAMTDTVVCTEFQGVEMFLRQYEVSAASHDGMRIDLQSVTLLDQIDDTVQIKAEAIGRFRICRRTLERFFPGIIQDEQLAQELIGKEYFLQYDKVFHFRRGRIFQHESRIDFCAGLLNMVGNPFVAMKLLQASLMSKHGHWKIDNGIQEDGHELQNSVLG